MSHPCLESAVGRGATALAWIAAGFAIGCAPQSHLARAARPTVCSSAKQDGPAESARTACSSNSDCTLIDREPCACGTLGARDVEAVSSEWAEEHPPTAPGSCPDCASERGTGLYPTCRGHRCAVLEVAASSLSRCDTAADCIAIDPSCCPPCGPYWRMVAVNRTRAGRLRTQVCGPDWEMMGCPACASPPMPTPALACVSHHCRITPGHP